ncbi:Hypothetical protein PMT_2504 [Prochlorococcus marinus str. MIT 9313]|uniref:Uncharacterized protein n=1 Tax=Prochlorococcus marinus (strain MIT 9313) TaxID=74547 RepID=B9ERZ4_PROMM|nr:hypothetical protein [Prochlorococcus marinus]CAX32022.1 Hypothetical protein PMT_2504 [Prochlorococcus marinus str. MIT 9313]
MTIEELKAVLSEQMCQRVTQVLTFEGEDAVNIEELYQQVPAGFRGKLTVRSGSQYVWDLWQTDEDTWEFSSTQGSER